MLQQPSTLWVPERLGSYGPEVVDFADAIGIPMDPEQRRDVDALASYGPRGEWLTPEAGVIEGRQNGKTKAELLPITLADLFGVLGEPDKMFWTSHLMKTSLDTFARVLELIEANAMLSRRVKEIVEAKSEQAIFLNDGSSLEFLARTAGGGRGLGGKRVVFDEALFLKVDAMGALLPTLRARGNPQINYGSSAGKAESDHLRSLQARGRRGGDPGLILIEYKADGGWDKPGCLLGERCTHIFGVEGCFLDNEDGWRQGNHAIGRGRMRIQSLRNERSILCRTANGVLEFGREALGWEELGSETVSRPIPMALWAKREDPGSLIAGAITIGIEIPPDRHSASIGVAGFRDDGLSHVELAWTGSTSDVVAQVVKMTKEQSLLDILDGKVTRPAIVGDKLALGPLMPAFKAVDIVPVLMGPAELVEACGQLQDDFENDKIRHPGQQQLADMLALAVKRGVGDGGWLWGKRLSAAGGGDISGIPAVTNANWALSHHQAPPFFGARR